jgi:excisionase family DNA binding protein
MLDVHIHAKLCDSVHAKSTKIGGKTVAITISMQKASEESGLSLRTLNYAIARGELDSVRVGRRRLIPLRSLEKYLLRKPRETVMQKRQTGRQAT